MPLVQVRSLAFAQGSSAPIWVVRSLPTGEYGVDDPKGLAFSAEAKTFLLLDGTSNVTLIAMAEEPAGTRVIAEVGADPLNAAFDERTDSLFVFDRGRSELAKVKADGSSTRFAAGALNVIDPQGIAFDKSSGRMFILDSGNSQVVSAASHATRGFDVNQVQRISLKGLGKGTFRGVAYNPSNGHLYLSEISQKKLHEITQSGELVNTFDLTALEISNPSAMTFAPSVDNTDDPNIYDLFILDTTSSGQIVELSLQEPAALPPGTTLLPATQVNIIDTSSWNPPAPDPAGIDYFPLTDRLIISDSEVDEMPIFEGKNIFLSTRSGNLTGTCTTFPFTGSGSNPSTGEPTGVAVNPNNNHIFIAADFQDRLFEISLGSDGQYCTSDDTVTNTSLGTAYGVTDAEDVAYGDNKVFIAGGADAEVYVISLGTDDMLGGVGGAADALIDQFDTASLGFADAEGIGFNHDAGTVFVVSTKRTDQYLGEFSTSGALLQAYDLSFMPDVGNIRSDVSYAPGSQNPSVKTIYIASRGVDNDSNPNENDGQIWEVNIGGTPGPTNTPTKTNTPGPSPTHTNTPTHTPTPTFTPTVGPSSNPFLSSFVNDGMVGSVAFGDEDILQFNGTTWSLFFDGSDVALPTAADVFAFHQVDADTILMSFVANVTLGGVTYTPRDIAQFDATSLGSTTAGTFSLYFNGVDVGLSASAENIDALEVLPNGKVLISTTGSPVVTGVTGALDEDILAFTPTTLGTNTSGTWALYFDGSAVGLADTNNEDIDALGVAANGDIYLSTLGVFAVTGVSGDDEDVFVCTPTSSPGATVTACTYSSVLYFDGSTWGQTSNDIDGFNLLNTGPIPTATPSNTPSPTNTPTNTATTGPSPTPTNTPTPSNTPTPTNTSNVLDVIFADGFESGNLSAWTSNINDVGDLSASASSALVGSQGMQAVIDDVNTIYVTDDSPNAEPRYRVRFYFDPNTIPMVSGNAHYIFKGFIGTSTEVIRVEFRCASGCSVSGTSYQIRATLLDDASIWINAPSIDPQGWVPITDAPHFIELDWRAATGAGANNGGLTLWIDGAQQADKTGVDNDTRRVDRARLGALTGVDAGTSGTYFFDAFESRRQTFIGP